LTNFIPLFPLSIVAFPGEKLNLHIFEPRYKQLVNDCYANKKPFGIATVLQNEIAETGTLVYITEIVKVYDDGKMDIKTEAAQIFNIIEKIETIPEKLYNGAIVTYPTINMNGNGFVMLKIVHQIKELHKHLHINKDFGKIEALLNTYDVAHHAGLALEEEYEFITILHELQRQEYLKRHLKKVLPIVAEMETLKQRVQLNGHFKNLKGFDL
jgi:uncharacterized protein